MPTIKKGAPRLLHPHLSNDGTHIPSFTTRECERDALRKYCRPMQGMRFLKVMIEETYTYLETVNSGKDRASRISVPYKESYMVALITIHNNHAYIQDLATNGRLKNYRPIPCNGSVSRKDIMDAIGVHDSDGTRVYAQKVKPIR